MQRIDIKLGFSCNNRCAFCVQGDKRNRHGPRPWDRISLDLQEGRNLGAGGVVFTGGEPTMQGHLLAAVVLARKLGYADIQIQSNGRLFAYEGPTRRLIRAGATEFSPALHGSTAEIHDRLTAAPGSHEQTVKGIRTLVGLGVRVITNTVITVVNYQDLPALARLFVELGVHQFQFAFVHVLGSAAENRGWLVPRKRDVMPHVHEGLEVGRRAGVRCMTEAIPFCLMRGYEQHVAEQIIPVTRVCDADQTLENYTEYRLSEGKAHGPPCQSCAMASRCEGPWREYPQQYGWDEFQAFKPEELEGEGAS